MSSCLKVAAFFRSNRGDMYNIVEKSMMSNCMNKTQLIFFRYTPFVKHGNTMLPLRVVFEHFFVQAKTIKQ